MGILSEIEIEIEIEIEVGEDGQVIPNSGVLRVRAWEPDDGLLEPRDYDWTPGEDLDGGGTANDPAQ